MYSRDDKAEDELGRELGTQLSVGTRLRMAQALQERETDLCDRWADALVAAPGGIYERVPRGDVLASARRLFHAYVEFLGTGDSTVLGHTILEAARRRFESGCALVALLQTVGAARVTILPALAEAFASDPAVLAEAVAALMAGEEMAAIWIAQAYETVSEVNLHNAQKERLQAEQEKVTFGREMARLATRERLILCDPADITRRDGIPALPIITPRDVRQARNIARAHAEALNWPDSRIYELQLCVGEAGTNALRHAGTASFQSWSDNDAVTFRIADSGPGIDFNRIPSALTSGYSTGASLGMGFTLMLELADTIRMATNHRGTVLQLTLARR